MLSITTDKNNVKDRKTVTLECTVPNFSDNIFVVQNTNNRAVGIVGYPVVPTDMSVYTVSTSGTKIFFKIVSFSKKRDVGSWLVRHGVTDSESINLSAFTEGEDDKEDGVSVGEDDKEDGLSVETVVGLVAATGVVLVGGIAATVFVVIKCCTTKLETIHAEIGTNVTLGYKIPNAGEVVWTKNGETFKDCRIGNVDVKDTVLQIHGALPKDSGLYVCSYGLNSEKLKYDLIIKENLEKIHAVIGRNVTLGYKIPNAGEVVWTKDCETFKDSQIGNVDVKGTVLKIHGALPINSGLYVCSYGPNSKKLKYDLSIREGTFGFVKTVSCKMPDSVAR